MITRAFIIGHSDYTRRESHAPRFLSRFVETEFPSCDFRVIRANHVGKGVRSLDIEDMWDGDRYTVHTRIVMEGDDRPCDHENR